MAIISGTTSAAGVPAHPENSLSNLLSQTPVLTRRLLIRLVRNPITIAFALMLPVLFLLTLDVVLGDSIEAITGENGLYRSVPLMALVAAISGSAVSMVGIIGEQLDGFLNRLWVLPLNRGAGLLARLFAEIIRLFATTLVILGVGLKSHSSCGVSRGRSTTAQTLPYSRPKWPQLSQRKGRCFSGSKRLSLSQ